MAYPDIRNPREVRSLIDNVYAGYSSGQDRFPRKRITVGYDALPQKTRRVAALLEYAWRVIDEDRDYFESAVLGTFDTLKSADNEGNSGLVVTRIGKNAVNLALISVYPEPIVEISEWSLPDFVERFEGHEFKLNDGDNITLREGKMQGPVHGIITRHSNVSGVYGTTIQDLVALMAAVSTTPILATTYK